MTLRARNKTPFEQMYSLGDHPVYDFWVVAGETTIWRLSYPTYPRSPTPGYQVTGETKFGSLEERTIRATWDQKLCTPGDGSFLAGPPSPGRYRALAMYAGNGTAWWTDPVEFEIR